MLAEESVEGRVGVFQRVLFAQQFIVVGALVPVGKDFEGFGDFMKLGLGSFPVLFVFVGVPFGS
jgi:hypothetical protein